jgi:hypothetical protein
VSTFLADGNVPEHRRNAHPIPAARRPNGPRGDSVLEALRAHPWHRFWPDSLPYERTQLGGVLGHRQVTDADLVALAADQAERLVTFDRGLSALHGDTVHLLNPAR